MATVSLLPRISRLSRESSCLSVFPTLDHKPARILAYVGVFEAPSSLWEVVEGLAGVDDGQNRHRRRKRLAVWQNLTFGGSGELVQLVDGSGELLLESLELFQLVIGVL